MAGINLWKYSVIEGAFSLDELIRERALFREEFRTNVLDELAKLYTNEGMALEDFVCALLTHQQQAIYSDSIYDLCLCSVIPDLISEGIMVIMNEAPLRWISSEERFMVSYIREFRLSDLEVCKFIYGLVNKVGNKEILKIMKR